MFVFEEGGCDTDYLTIILRARVRYEMVDSYAIWDRREIPDYWNQGVIIKIPKKGALSECSNWRGITLLSTPSKILAKVIMKRLS